MRGVIVTADDFGLHTRVNDAVARAHREGVLTCASLMVSAPAARHAVEIAREHPGLRVGLHIVLADGPATLPASQISALVGADGRFEDRMVRDGFRFFFLPKVRRHLANEIRAQFEAFAQTGLALDHVNTHKHFHLHPTVLSMILEIGREFGMRAMRLPREQKASPLLAFWAAWTKRRLALAGIACNDWVAGISSTGHMNEETFLALLAHPPEGVFEIYCHPATEHHAVISESMKTYCHADELAALCSPRVKQAIAATGAKHGAFTDVFGVQERAVRNPKSVPA